MSVLRMALRQLRSNRTTALLMATAVCFGAMLLPLSESLLDLYAEQTRRVLGEKDAEVKERMHEMWDEYRRITLGLGFNILILPQGQSLADYYAEGKITRDMPEEYSQRLARSGIISVQHVLPSLHHRMTWKPYGVGINLIGVRGELPSMGGRPPKKPLREAVAEGKVVLGSELCRIAGAKPGARLTFLGRTFTVDSCHEARGDQDDMTAWIDLATLQKILGREGRINAILALECRCEADSSLPNIAKIRQDLEAVLPGTRVIEFMSQALTRAEARHKAVLTARDRRAAEERHREELGSLLERLSRTLVPLCAVACMAAIALITWVDTRNRRREIAVLRAVGWTSGRVFRLLLTRTVAAGVVGATFGVGLAAALALLVHVRVSVPFRSELTLWTAAALGAVLLSIAAAWLPALAAATSDPAPILQKE